MVPRLRRLEERADHPRQEWFSIKEAAKLTGLSEDHIRRAVVGGVLPCSNVGTPSRALYRISRDSVARWMKEREVGPKPPPRRKKDVGPRPLPFSPHVHRSKYAPESAV